MPVAALPALPVPQRLTGAVQYPLDPSGLQPTPHTSHDLIPHGLRSEERRCGARRLLQMW